VRRHAGVKKGSGWTVVEHRARLDGYGHEFAIVADEEKLTTVRAPSWIPTTVRRDSPLSGAGRETLHVHFGLSGFVRRVGEPPPVRGNRRLFFVELRAQQWGRRSIAIEGQQPKIFFRETVVLQKHDEAPVGRPRLHVLRRG